MKKFNSIDWSFTKYFMLFLLIIILFSTRFIYSQSNGTQLIYNSGQFGIGYFQAFKQLNCGVKDIYIQLGVNFVSSANESGTYLKLNKSSMNWYIPANGFINAAWGQEFPYGTLQCQPVSFFTISNRDTNLVIKFQITPAASCPDANTLYTINGGVNWYYAPFACGGTIIYPTGGDYNPRKDSTMIYGYYNMSPGIHRTDNGGFNWQHISTPSYLRVSSGASPPFWQENYGFLKYNPFDTSFVYANGISHVFHSTNGGYNFDSSGVKWMKDILVSYKDSILYGYNDYKLYRSSNKGIGWDSVQTNIRFSTLEVNPDLPNILYGGDSLGVYRSTNYGTNWYLYNNSFTPSKIIIGISKDAGTGDTFYVVTKKNVYKVWASFIVNEEGQSSLLPDKYQLYQNYPNPFNPVTNIKFDLPKNGFVTLRVFDILGRENTTLVNENLNAGSYETSWDGSNYPSGVYFYKIVTDEYSDVKKMLLVK